jgi:hypothetical protein
MRRAKIAAIFMVVACTRGYIDSTEDVSGMVRLLGLLAGVTLIELPTRKDPTNEKVSVSSSRLSVARHFIGRRNVIYDKMKTN